MTRISDKTNFIQSIEITHLSGMFGNNLSDCAISPAGTLFPKVGADIIVTVHGDVG